MDYNHRYFLELLSAALNQENPAKPTEMVDWETIYRESIAHEVHPLIYTVVKKLGLPSTGVFDSFSRAVLFAVTRQAQYLDEVKRVLKELNLSDIHFIALKGLMHRKYYPQAELRTMGDFDLLVRPEQLGSVGVVLDRCGYVRMSEDAKHQVFIKPNCAQIEIHHSLFTQEDFIDPPNYTELSWQNAVKEEIDGVSILVQGPEDLLAYSILHAAKHFKKAGIGLRQLCDLFYLLKTPGPNFDTDYFNQLLAGGKCTRFFDALQDICILYFHAKADRPTDQNTADEVLEVILAGGIYGRKTGQAALGNALGGKLTPSEAASLSTPVKLKRMLTAYLFPPRDKLAKRYAYAIKKPILLPIAWCHRFTRFLSTTKLSFSLFRAPGQAAKKMSLMEKLDM